MMSAGSSARPGFWASRAIGAAAKHKTKMSFFSMGIIFNCNARGPHLARLRGSRYGLTAVPRALRLFHGPQICRDVVHLLVLWIVQLEHHLLVRVVRILHVDLA